MTATATETSGDTSESTRRAPGTPKPTVLQKFRNGDWGRRGPLLPALIFMIIVTQLPFVATLVISFMDWNAYRPDSRGFTGFHNYALVFQDDVLRSAVLTTIIMTVSVVLVSLVLGFAIALLLDRTFFGRGFVRTMMITPFLVVPVAAAQNGASPAGSGVSSTMAASAPADS